MGAGTKQRHQEAEEVQPLMFANSLLAAARQMGAGYVLTQQEVDRRIAEFNRLRAGTAAACLGRERHAAVMALTFRVPAAAFQVLYKAYQDYTWNLSWMNARILSHSSLIPGQTDSTARGSWTRVYTSSEATACLVVDIMDLTWRSRFPKATVAQVPRQALQTARPDFEALVRTNLRACVWTNWIWERIGAEGASLGATREAVENLREHFMRGYFDDEIDTLVLARSNAGTYQMLNLSSSLPSIHRQLSGQHARLSNEETLSQANAAARQQTSTTCDMYPYLPNDDY